MFKKLTECKSRFVQGQAYVPGQLDLTNRAVRFLNAIGCCLPDTVEEQPQLGAGNFDCLACPDRVLDRLVQVDVFPRLLDLDL